MEALLDFARGPLFRLCFVLMILGLARIALLDIWGIFEAHRKAGNPNMPWSMAFKKTAEWLFPINHLTKTRPFYSIISIVFHMGLLLVPLFLYAHVQLWEGVLSFGWFTLSKELANILTLITIAGALGLFIMRLVSRSSRFLSRKQDYFWPLLLIIPFISGYICANLTVSATAYQIFMLIHILAGNLIFILMPFTKIAHCVLMPLSQFVMIIAWRFPANTDDKISTTLNKKGEPV